MKKRITSRSPNHQISGYQREDSKKLSKEMRKPHRKERESDWDQKSQ